MDRLHKYLAAAGIDSRRKCEALIFEGRVSVNGKIVTEPGTKVDPDSDYVSVDNKVVKPLKGRVYIALNKPEGYISTVSDTHNRATVVDLVKDIKRRLYPVGRLDYDSSGLLLMTDDGDVAYALTHPSKEIYKTYIVKAKNSLSETDIDLLKSGVELSDGITLPAFVRSLDPSSKLIEVRLREGRNRQVRRMFEAISNKVLELTRIKMGPVALGELAKGQYRYLSSAEVSSLLDILKTPKPNFQNRNKREVNIDGTTKPDRQGSDNKCNNQDGLQRNNGSKEVFQSKEELRGYFRGKSKNADSKHEVPAFTRHKNK